LEQVFATSRLVALGSCQESEARGTLCNASGRIQCDVQVVRLPPQALRLLRRATLVLEDRETANGVCEVERASALVAAVDRQGFDVTGFCRCRSARVIVSIAQVAHSVSESEGVTPARALATASLDVST